MRLTATRVRVRIRTAAKVEVKHVRPAMNAALNMSWRLVEKRRLQLIVPPQLAVRMAL